MKYSGWPKVRVGVITSDDCQHEVDSFEMSDELLVQMHEIQLRPDSLISSIVVDSKTFYNSLACTLL